MTPPPMPVSEFQEKHQIAIGTNTYVSIGFVIVLIGATWAILNQIADVKTRVDKLEWNQAGHETRLQQREAIRYTETWNDRDMLQWTVHLQKDNPTLKVPEPPMHLSNP